MPGRSMLLYAGILRLPFGDIAFCVEKRIPVSIP